MRINSIEIFEYDVKIKNNRVFWEDDENLKPIICLDFGKSKISDSNYNLIIGENGSGKSRFLKYIQGIFYYLESLQSKETRYNMLLNFIIDYSIGVDNYYIKKQGLFVSAEKNNKYIAIEEIPLPSNVMAVSFMVSDKFRFSKNDSGIYKYLGVRAAANNTYTSSVFQKLTRSLLIAIQKGRRDGIYKILNHLGLDSDYAGIEYSIENPTYGEPSKYDSKFNYLEDTSLVNSRISELLSINDVKYRNLCFTRKGKQVSVLQLSSGELHLLFSMIGILACIEDDSLILIDEPEISLHPEWQVSYISKMKSVFDDYKKCSFVIASHSHYLVSDMPVKNSTVVVFRKDEKDYSYINTEVIPYSTYAWSAESILYNVFGIRTTRNYYFESDLADLIDAIEDENKVDISTAREKLERLKRYVLPANDPLTEVLQEAEEYINVHS